MIPIGADESEPSQSRRMWELYASTQASAARRRAAGWPGHTTKATRPTRAPAPTPCVGPLCASNNRSTSGRTPSVPNRAASRAQVAFELSGGVPCTSQPAARPASACPTGDGIRSEDYSEPRRNRAATRQGQLMFPRTARGRGESPRASQLADRQRYIGSPFTDFRLTFSPAHS